jgi:hypothetical protein
MPPATYSLTLYRGDTHRWSFRCWQDAAKTIPADLTGMVPKAEIREAPSGSTIVTMTCTLSLPNTIDVLLSSTLSKTVPSGGVWDLQLTDSGGEVKTIVAGATSLTPDITDSTIALALKKVAR